MVGDKGGKERENTRGNGEGETRKKWMRGRRMEGVEKVGEGNVEKENEMEKS